MKTARGVGQSHRRLLRLQQRIFHSLQESAETLLGKPPASILRYEREYLADFRGLRARAPLRQLSKGELIGAIREADVTFIADYHTFGQAQRTALRLIRDSHRAGETWEIGLEMFSSDCQPALDEFSAGRIGESEFLRAVRYESQWGFSWRNYRPLFEWAKQNSVPLLALNMPDEGVRAARDEDRELEARDEWAVDCIVKRLSGRKGPRQTRVGRSVRDLDLTEIPATARMIVLYGEMHVGQKHLPAALKRADKRRRLRSVTIHQNNDKLYWELAREGQERDTSAVHLSGHTYCVISGTPWAKLQSLISWAENEQEVDVEEGEPHDYLSSMRLYGEAISEFLRIPAPSFEALTAKTLQEADFVDSLAEVGHFTRLELEIIRAQVADNERLYVSRLALAYLATPSQNRIAELSAIHVLRTRTDSLDLFRGTPEDFFRICIEACFGFFGSLIINPRRKCDLPADLARKLLGRATPREKKARELSMRLLGGESGRPVTAAGLRSAVGTARLGAYAWNAARYAGQILGQQLYQALLAEEISADLIIDHCLLPATPGPRVYQGHYLALVKSVNPGPAGGSKSHVF